MAKHSYSDLLNESYQSRNSSGSKKGSLDFSKMGKDVKFFKVKEGTNKICIVPYVIKSKNHPRVHAGKFDIGDLDYVLDVWVHRNIGPTNADVICPKKTYGKPCPICDASDDFYKTGKEKESSAFRAKRRVFYNVVDASNPGTIMILDQSHFGFEKELLEAAHDDDAGSLVDFIDPKKGKGIKFKGSEETFNGQKFFKPKNFAFFDRGELNVEDYLEDAISLDELIITHSSDELYAILNGVDTEGEADDEPVRTREASTVSRTPKNDDDDEEESPKKAPKEDAPTCPHGHVFGKDNDEYKECDSCKVWKDCARAAR